MTEPVFLFAGRDSPQMYVCERGCIGLQEGMQASVGRDKEAEDAIDTCLQSSCKQ